MTDSFSNKIDSVVPDEVSGPLKKVADKTAQFDPIELAHRAGIRSSHAYIGGFASIILSIITWSTSRAKPTDSKAQSDRWGIFIGHWAPTFFAIGLALKSKEND